MVSAMRIFIDSSILVEYIKGANTELLETILKFPYECDINHIVYSEFIFHFLSAMTGKSPLTLKSSNIINETLYQYEPIELIENFKILEMNEDILTDSYEFMKKYNLLPNDSLILSTCKYYGINHLASYNSDFKKACNDENIFLINSILELNKI